MTTTMNSIAAHAHSTGANGLNGTENDIQSALRFITCGSVDDGKSTLIGRLLVDSRSGNNLLYLPLDKLIGTAPAAGTAPTLSVVPAPTENQSAAAGTDVRSRDGARTRDREGR